MAWTVTFQPSQAREKKEGQTSAAGAAFRGRGRMTAPPAKSMAHRMLICAGLAEGESRIRGIGHSQDVLATLDCLRALGAQCEADPEISPVNLPKAEPERAPSGSEAAGDCVIVRGADLFHVPRGAVLPCRECGSTLRFLVPAALLGGRELTMTGSRKLMERPLSVYEDLCGERGLSFVRNETSIRLRGPLLAGDYVIRGDVSSQFVSGLLFVLPLLEKDSTLRLVPPVESRPYIDMTLEAMRRFGVTVLEEDDLTFRIPGGQKYLACDLAVEGDWSNAAFLLAMGMEVDGLNPQSLQGDRCCTAYFDRLRREFAELDISNCPDLGPVLFVFAAMHAGGRFTGTRRLRDKESDRIAAMQEELGRCGVRTLAEENAFTVYPGFTVPSEPIEGHRDHRIVMAMSVLCARTGGTITGAEAVTKSYPDFFERIREAGIVVEKEGCSASGAAEK